MLTASLLLALVPAPPIPQEGYRLPPPEVVALVDAPTTPSTSISEDGRWMLERVREPLPSIADLARPMLRLAGLRLDPASGGRYQTSFSSSFMVRPLAAAEERGGWRGRAGESGFEGVFFSPNSEHVVAITNHGRSIALTAWGLEGEGAPQPIVLSQHLATVLGGRTVWMPDGKSLILFEVPEDRGDAPAAPAAPTGPNVRETSGSVSALRTYQDLLASPHDEALFEHYATTQLVIADVETGVRRLVGKPGLFTSASPSPDGRHLLVTRLERPFSYSMPYYQFPQSIEVWDLRGRHEHLVAAVPLGENIPLHGVRTGPRSVGWRADEGAELLWVEALDGGDPESEVEHRDRWMSLAVPFDGAPAELLRLEHRARGLSWMDQPGRALASEFDRDRRWSRTWLVDFAGEVEPVVVEDRSVNDRYGNPGSAVTHRNARGKSVVLQDGPWIWRTGRGDGPGGARPFLDRQNLETLESERLWQCAEGEYESVTRVLAAPEGGVTAFVTSHESPSEPPNWRLRELAEPGSFKAITAYPDPQPGLRGITKQLVTYERADGVPLSATLYLPAGYEPGTPLPLIVWAYPMEYNDVTTAGQVSGSPYRFTRIGGSSHLFFLTQGYAVMDSATMPIVGDPETMNDTFIEQIVAAAQAAIDEAVTRGVADPERVVVGGHSYGAFMTANLLAHCDLFAAGLARSGAYNRTLTPFGFQSERRTLWESPETYFAISPFMHADDINEPLLLIHGEMDNNSGTFPIQSERLFQAIKGHGGTARLVYLPHESHGYRARESILHTLAEMIDWCAQYAGPTDPQGQ